MNRLIADRYQEIAARIEQFNLRAEQCGWPVRLQCKAEGETIAVAVVFVHTEIMSMLPEVLQLANSVEIGVAGSMATPVESVQRFQHFRDIMDL